MLTSYPENLSEIGFTEAERDVGHVQPLRSLRGSRGRAALRAIGSAVDGVSAFGLESREGKVRLICSYSTFRPSPAKF